MEDQLPISGNKEMKVELIEPKFKENSLSLKKNRHEYLEWLLELEPGENVKIPLTFSVEYPSDKVVSGL
ncbi:MAG TPA: DUF4139 domain-containing protein [Chitinispirillaceae bacterium]|nr:DUF4139 domain-containing protein [Chitinispirillaceae bacterium]